MRVNYKGYTLILDFKGKGMFVKTKILELNKVYKDIAMAKRYIDTFYN